MIRLAPFSNAAGWAVLTRLDLDDALEAAAYDGHPVDAFTLLRDWQTGHAAAQLSQVACTSAGTPFALILVAPTGQAGVSQAALLSRDHRQFGPHLARLAVLIRDGIDAWSEQVGVRRIEARSHADHPRADRLLRFCGFDLEARLPGFGASGDETFHQYAWLSEGVRHVQTAQD